MANIQNGMAVSGTGIPADSIIIGNDGASQITIGDRSGMPVNATADGTEVTLSIVGEYPKKIQISGNELTNTPMVLGKVSQASVTNNLMIFPPSDTTSKGIYLSNIFSQASISGNTVMYGLGGVISDVGLTDVTISGNAFMWQNYYGLNVGEANTNLLISNNVISNDATANAGNYQAIRVGSGTRVKSNSINIATGYSTIRVVGDTSGIIVQGNNTSNAAYNGSSRYDIRVESGSTSSIIVNNQCNDVVSDAGTTTVLRDNDAF
jgi:hypothetical protein